MTRFPLYKGATRVPTVAGVPLVPAIMLVTLVASATVIFGMWWLVLLLPGWLLMAQITRTDDRAFRIVWLFLLTKLSNRVRIVFGGPGELWGASSYALSEGRRRSHDAEDLRWLG